VIGPWDDDKVYFLLDDKCLYLYKKWNIVEEYFRAFSKTKFIIY
jgi:hypothetical protein